MVVLLRSRSHINLGKWFATMALHLPGNWCTALTSSLCTVPLYSVSNLQRCSNDNGGVCHVGNVAALLLTLFFLLPHSSLSWHASHRPPPTTFCHARVDNPSPTPHPHRASNGLADPSTEFPKSLVWKSADSVALFGHVGSICMCNWVNIHPVYLSSVLLGIVGNAPRNLRTSTSIKE